MFPDRLNKIQRRWNFFAIRKVVFKHFFLNLEIVWDILECLHVNWKSFRMLWKLVRHMDFFFLNPNPFKKKYKSGIFSKVVKIFWAHWNFSKQHKKVQSRFFLSRNVFRYLWNSLYRGKSFQTNWKFSKRTGIGVKSEGNWGDWSHNQLLY